MRKYRLELEELSVETFETIEAEDARGTVQAQQVSGIDTCETGLGSLCQSSRRQTPCCTNLEYNCSLPLVC